MNMFDLQSLLSNEVEIRKAIRSDEVAALLKGKFETGRLPNIYQVTFPDGGQLRLKFYDTVKRIYNNKGVEQLGRESYLSYVEISVLPAGVKGYFFTILVQQVTWAPSHAAARSKHDHFLSRIKETVATPFGIGENEPIVWTTTYTENY